MSETAETVTVYDVAVDHGTLKGKTLGSQGTRYSVALKGLVDERWARSYRLIQMDSTGFFRFRFDLANQTVSFTARGGDGAEEIILLLERLDALVKLVNRSASLWTAGQEEAPGPGL
jgi:hypothetical protein